MIAVPNAKHHLMLDEPLAFVAALRSVLTMWEVDAGD
jgi:pimeloyl-ACP methyl ester carboxylesterase